MITMYANILYAHNSSRKKILGLVSDVSNEITQLEKNVPQHELKSKQ